MNYQSFEGEKIKTFKSDKNFLPLYLHNFWQSEKNGNNTTYDKNYNEGV